MNPKSATQSSRRSTEFHRGNPVRGIFEKWVLQARLFRMREKYPCCHFERSEESLFDLDARTERFLGTQHASE